MTEDRNSSYTSRRTNAESEWRSPFGATGNRNVTAAAPSTMSWTETACAQTQTTRTLTARYADRSTTTRTYTLPEPTVHTPTFTTHTYDLHDHLAFQRARVRSLALRTENLLDAQLAIRHLLFDPDVDRAWQIETAVDRVRRRFGQNAAGPATGAQLTGE